VSADLGNGSLRFYCEARVRGRPEGYDLDEKMLDGLEPGARGWAIPVKLGSQMDQPTGELENFESRSAEPVATGERSARRNQLGFQPPGRFRRRTSNSGCRGALRGAGGVVSAGDAGAARYEGSCSFGRPTARASS